MKTAQEIRLPVSIGDRVFIVVQGHEDVCCPLCENGKYGRKKIGRDKDLTLILLENGSRIRCPNCWGRGTRQQARWVVEHAIINLVNLNQSSEHKDELVIYATPIAVPSKQKQNHMREVKPNDIWDTPQLAQAAINRRKPLTTGLYQEEFKRHA